MSLRIIKLKNKTIVINPVPPPLPKGLVMEPEETESEVPQEVDATKAS